MKNLTLVATFWLAVIVAGSHGCALINGFGSSDDDDGPPDCVDDPLAADCQSFTCANPFQLGIATPELSVTVDTCGMASTSDLSICTPDGRTADMTLSFDILDANPYMLCVRGLSGGTFLPMAGCDFPVPAADAGPMPTICLSDESCMEVFPTQSGPQFLMWESFGPGACGKAIIEVFPMFGPVDGGMDGGSDGGPVDGPVDGGPDAIMDGGPVG